MFDWNTNSNRNLAEILDQALQIARSTSHLFADTVEDQSESSLPSCSGDDDLTPMPQKDRNEDIGQGDDGVEKQKRK